MITTSTIYTIFIIAFIIFIAILPIILANKRGLERNIVGFIALIILLTGWTVVGWLVAIGIALMAKPEKPI